ncbi:2-keto-4-pentenoate hydratase/2-oxohepta-3-ene-1,7-dioic acid hydratase [Xenococcus sp. PCC 7305]|uniref:fumarylacetoacetate hydrolase family protein n=1 Tax=Xenococcus sp. PCC 7305 TaxID=102125 RepID=UPI0002ACC460|nr:fumarylacetoacetate hydrolase family protein [Xenococcus sp. PCC 7305]ELS04755.1 2-keto-4-pentenoate hydratase/2-oxohepta-3-ene-1,7-dioic acid hydratase [Xenococcus sp. PCC 7305]
MTKRYVRVKTNSESVYYGLLQPNRGVAVLDAPPWLNGQVTDLELEADTYQLLAPCVPSKIVAVGKNYVKHAAEMGTEAPKEPLLFLKPNTAIIPDGAGIRYPQISKRVDYEGELAIVIGERCYQQNLEQASKAIWGYTIANDVTARDLQKKDGQWTRAKGFDTFCPLGPWIIRELATEATLETFLNSEAKPRQSAIVTEMKFSPEFLVSYISGIMTLMPGDVILTGTPQGIGAMQKGDRVTVEIEGIGSLSNYVEIT